MIVEEAVRKAVTPQAALLIIARGIDELSAQLSQIAAATPSPQPDPWAALSNAGFATDDRGFVGAPIETEVTDKEITVTIAGVSDERKEDRRRLATAMGLVDEFGASEDWVEVYAKGGPLWLYNVKRDFVVSLPADLREAMVADIALDDAATAQEVGRDLLKDTTPQTRDTVLPLADIVT